MPGALQTGWLWPLLLLGAACVAAALAVWLRARRGRRAVWKMTPEEGRVRRRLAEEFRGDRGPGEGT